MEDCWWLKGIEGALKRLANSELSFTKDDSWYWNSPLYKKQEENYRKIEKVLLRASELLRFKAAYSKTHLIKMEEGKLIFLSHKTQKDKKRLEKVYTILSECYSDGMLFRLIPDGYLLPFGYIFKEEK